MKLIYYNILIYSGFLLDFHVTFYCEDTNNVMFYSFLFPTISWFTLSGFVLLFHNKTFVELVLSFNCLVPHGFMLVPLIKYNMGYSNHDPYIAKWQALGPLLLFIAYSFRISHYPEKYFVKESMHNICGNIMCAELGNYWDKKPQRNTEKMEKLCKQFEGKYHWYFYYLPSHTIWHITMFIHHLSRWNAWRLALKYIVNNQCI